MIELTKKYAKRLGGALEVTDIGNHQLRIVFFDNQEDDLARIRRQLLGVGILEFRLLHPKLIDLKNPPEKHLVPDGYEVQTMLCSDDDGRDDTRYYLVEPGAQMNETVVAYTEVTHDDFGSFSVTLHLTPVGKARLAEVTGSNVGRHLGILFDGTLYCAPRIIARIESDSAQITGQFTQREALELANILNNPLGLPASITVEP